MGPDLRERLAALAGDAPGPEGRPDAAADLWRRGRRRQARERLLTGTAVVVALACLGAAVGLGGLARTAPDPAAPQRAVGLPDRLYPPSPWLTGTAGHPIGPLVALLDASRSSWHGWTSRSRSGLVAVSATTGDYRFLDLPDAAQDSAQDSGLPLGEAVSLAPDGRHVGYWLAGSRPDDRGVRRAAAVGYAVYDTVTGRVRRYPVAARLGLQPIGVGWTADRAWFQYAEVASRSVSGSDETVRLGDRTTVLVDADSGAVRPGPGRLPDLRQVSAGATGFTVVDGRTVRVVTGPTDAGRVLRSSRALVSAYLSPDGRRLAGFPAADECCPERPVLAGRPGRPGRPGSATVAMTPVRDVVGVAVLGWRDDTHLVVQRADAVVQSVDVTTGATRTLVRLPAGSGPQGVRLAGGLLAAPVVPGRRPPDAHDPRRPVLLGALVALGGGLLLVAGTRVRRRRVRP